MYRSTTAFPTEIQYIRSSLFWVYIHMYMYCIYVAIYIYTYMDQNTYTLHIDFHKQTHTHAHTHTWLYLIMYIHTYLCTCLCIYKGMLVILTIFAPKWKCGRGTVYLRFHHRFLEHWFRCHQRTASVLADSGQRKSCMGSDSIADKLKDSWWTDFQICLHPLDHVKSTCSFSLFSTEMFCPTVETGMPNPLHCKEWLATVPAIPRIDAAAFVHQCGMNFHVSYSESPKSSCNGLS